MTDRIDVRLNNAVELSLADLIAVFDYRGDAAEVQHTIAWATASDVRVGDVYVSGTKRPFMVQIVADRR